MLEPDRDHTGTRHSPKRHSRRRRHPGLLPYADWLRWYNLPVPLTAHRERDADYLPLLWSLVEAAVSR